MSNWYLNYIFAGLDSPAMQESPEKMQLMMQKLKDRGHRYDLDDVDDPTKEKLYQQTYDSYTKGETGQSWTRDQWFNKVRNGPWTFYGDKDFTGYITVRELWEIKGLAKLVGCAGAKRGMLAGLAKLNSDNLAVFGAVTPELYQMALKAGFKTVDAMTLQLFVKVAPSEVWGYGGKPTIGPNGELSINMPELGKTISKQFICNQAFLAWTEQQKAKFMSGKMKGFGF